MKINRLKTRDYSIIIGKNSISNLTTEIKKHCPKCKKVMDDKRVKDEKKAYENLAKANLGMFVIMPTTYAIIMRLTILLAE